MPKRDNPRTGPKYEKMYVKPDRRGKAGSKAVRGGSDDAGRRRTAEKGAYSSGSFRASGINAAKNRYRGANSALGKNDPGTRVCEAYGDPNILVGRNPVNEAIKAGRPIDKILMQKDAEGSARSIAGKAKEQGIPVQYVDKLVLDKLAPGQSHQGIAAYAAAHRYVGIEDILDAAKAKGQDPLVVILDGLEDPHNLGAVLRSADAAGAHGVIIPSRRSVTLTQTVAKASAGAIEYVPVAKTGNLSRCIDLLKSKGLWIAAVDMDGEPYDGADLKGPLALIIGGEGSGVSRNLREKSDYIVSIPMHGHVNSLNASNAAAIVLFESARQRMRRG